MNVGLVVHPGRPDAKSTADAARNTLEAARVAVRILDGDTPDISALDLVIAFGGDGTFLRAAHLCGAAGVAVLGVNLGRLGFLAEIELEHLDAALVEVAAGRLTFEDRATLALRAEDVDGGMLAEDWALNEISIEKTARQRLLLLDVHVGGDLFAKVPADALVVATPTGSTAYAFSAGGPVVSPLVDAMLVVPVAPHTLFDRTLVAGLDETLRIHVLVDQPDAVVSADGRPPVTVPAGGTIEIRRGVKPVRVARVGRSDFYGTVRRKFGLH